MTTLPLPPLRPALRKGRGIALALGLACVAFSPASAAPIVANFTDGNSSSHIDAYTGMAGDGWATAWGMTGNGSMTRSATVLSDNPLSGGGNYLQATGVAAHQSASRSMTVGRRYSGDSQVKLNEAHSVSFEYRLDSANMERIYFFDASSLTHSAEALGTTWLIRADPAGPATGLSSGVFRLYYGPGNDNRFSPTGFAFNTGDVYRFTINVTPAVIAADSRWSVRIDNLTASTFWDSNDVRPDGLAFYTPQTSVGGYLNFTLTIPVGGTGSYSLDNITVIPESSTVALASAGLLSLGLARYLRPRREVR